MLKLARLAMVVCFIDGVTSQIVCRKDKYGPACQYDCHCPGLTCDRDEGCAGVCDKYNGWDGSTCQRQNVVLKLSNVQEGPVVYRTGGVDYGADLVVDGRTGHDLFSLPKTCALALDDKRVPTVKAWWNVTLDQEYYIYRFELYNRIDGAPKRINGFILSVGRSSVPGFDFKDCYRDNHTNNPPAILKKTCINNTPLKGDVIQIRQTTYEALQICELIVYECVPGKWGEHCTETCNCLAGISCNKVTGRCPEDKCAAGYEGETGNKKCPNDKWGFECSRSCGNCRGDNVCYKTSWICPKITENLRCKPGYLESDRYCYTACVDGKWGDNCGFTCSENCIGFPCQKENGACPDGGCLRGYTGDTCDNECSIGSWGYNCNETCSMNCLNGYASCSRLNGTCVDGCVKGFKGERCQLRGCSAGSWGYNCNETCSMNCLNGYASCSRLNGTCVEGCVKGFKGERCHLTVKGTTNSQPESPSAMLIGGSVAAVVVVIIAVAVLVIFRRRRLQTKRPVQDVSLGTIEEDSDSVQMSPSGAEYQHSPRTSRDSNKTEYENIIDTSLEKKVAVHQETNPRLNVDPMFPDSNDHEYLELSELSEYEIPETNDYLAPVYPKATSAPLPVLKFALQFAQKKTGDHFKVEYQNLPVGHRQLKCVVGSREENRKKNRYRNVIAYDHSRVVLNTLKDNMNTDYINACYIDGFNQPTRYIASQGPTDIMVDDFLRMIFEQNAVAIVMLTDQSQHSKLKCLKYWSKRHTAKFGMIVVKLHKQEQFADYVVRELRFTHLKTKKTNKVQQFHFTSWQDHGVPTHADGLLYFRDKVNNCDSKLQGGPIVVHCSDGVGRSGTYIALDYLLQEAQALGSVDVRGCIKKLREQRVDMVKTEAQYVFLHEALMEAFRMSDSSISSDNFARVYKELRSVNIKTGRIRLAEQFEDLCSTTIVPSKHNTDRARDHLNIDKNRHREILPAEDCRPHLSTPVPGGTDYINAVFIPTHKSKKGFIITQMPLTNTVVDFWRLVYDHSVHTIVMLNTEDEHDQMVGVYWTDDSQKFGPFDVTVTDKDTTRDDFHIWTYSLKHKDEDDTILVKQFRCKFWSDKMSQNSIGSTLTLIYEILPTVGKNPIIVHCMDGFTRSGLFCTSCAVVEKIKMDLEVNILQAVKRMRAQRPEIIIDLGQYNFLHKLVLGYLSSPVYEDLG